MNMIIRIVHIFEDFTGYLSPAPRFTPVLWWGPCCSFKKKIVCCPFMCLYFLSTVLWCPLQFPHINDVQFFFASSCLQEGSCLIYVICLHIVVSNTSCVVFSFILCNLCCQFLWTIHFWLLFRYYLMFIFIGSILFLYYSCIYFLTLDFI